MIYYFIVNTNDITQKLIDWAIEDNIFTLRTNLDGSKTILKYKHDKIPIELKQLETSPMTKSEIHDAVTGEGWQNAE